MQTVIRLNNSDYSLDGKYQGDAEHLLIICDSTYGAFTVTLPDCTMIKDKEFMFKNIGANDVTIACKAYQTIFTAGAVTSHVISTGDFFSVRSDVVSQWIALDSNAAGLWGA